MNVKFKSGSDEPSKHTVSLPIFGLLGIAFVVLKLTKTIDWSWWWVTLPFWITPAIVLFIYVFMVLFAIILAMFK